LVSIGNFADKFLPQELRIDRMILSGTKPQSEETAMLLTTVNKVTAHGLFIAAVVEAIRKANETGLSTADVSAALAPIQAMLEDEG
jgi:hypothetical protein